MTRDTMLLVLLGMVAGAMLGFRPRQRARPSGVAMTTLIRQHFIMRVTRYGPLVPARLVEIDHEPGEPDNTRDRWPPFVLCADVAGEVVPPEQLTERFFWQPPHWKHVKEISQREYEHLFALMRRAETDDPSAPVLRPRKRVDPAAVALPSFAEENAR